MKTAKQTKSIAIIGEGETEWFYFDSLRSFCRYPFRIAPDFPQHADIVHFIKMAEQYDSEGYDKIVCLIDMDRILANPAEMNAYRSIRKRTEKLYANIEFIETNPCTEFWFLLHYMPNLHHKHYGSYRELENELRIYMPGYDKTKRYFQRTNLYQYLTTNGNLELARANSKILSEISKQNKDDYIAYSEVYKVFNIIESFL